MVCGINDRPTSLFNVCGDRLIPKGFIIDLFLGCLRIQQSDAFNKTFGPANLNDLDEAFRFKLPNASMKEPTLCFGGITKALKDVSDW
jgi:hypothetical protein